MAIIIGENSYVTELEADSYFADRFGNDGWGEEVNKDKALVSAFSMMNAMCEWLADFEEPFPQGIKDAQCEIAFAISATGSTVTDGGSPLVKLKAGSVELAFDAKSNRNPLVSDLTSNLLAEYGICNKGGGTKIIPIGRM